MISLITRDEVSTAKEKHNNISLRQSRSHLVLTSACQSALSDKDLLDLSMKADIYITYERVCQ